MIVISPIVLRCVMLFFYFLSFTIHAQHKAIFVILDGIPADVIENGETPAIDAIAAKGKYTRGYLGGDAGGYSESPTVSAVGYNHLLTGVWSNKHNVRDNDIKEPNYNYRNIFRIAETANPKLKTAIFSTWTDNRTKLIGEGLAAGGNIKLDYAFDGFDKDTVRFPHDKEGKYIFNIDEKVSKEAGRYILNEGPDLSWVYLEYTDHIGHTFGDSHEMNDAVKKADIQVGRIWAAIQEREKKFNEQWMLLITTDHGRDAMTGKNHGGQSERERTIWMVTNVTTTNEHFIDNPATVDIMPSILRFMNITIPENILSELDGVPFIGPVSITNLKTKLHGSKIFISWDVLDPTGKAVVQISTTNNFYNGGKDEYKTVGEVDVAAGMYSIDIHQLKSGFYKVLLKAPHNTLNRWILPQAPK